MNFIDNFMVKLTLYLIRKSDLFNANSQTNNKKSLPVINIIWQLQRSIERPHCTKNYLNIRMQLMPVMDEVDATLQYMSGLFAWHTVSAQKPDIYCCISVFYAVFFR